MCVIRRVILSCPKTPINIMIFFTDNGRWYDFRGDAIIKWSECRHDFRGNYNYIETV